MDKQLLDALSNLSVALEKISESLDKKKGESKTAVGSALQSGDFSEQLKEINNGVKAIKTDTSKILDNQQTIIQLSKEKSAENSLFGGDKKSGAMDGIKKGVGMIVLIAGGILAIGLAFKLIGEVDFSSVLALSLSLPMIAYSFEKIAAMDLDYSSALSIFGIITSMSLSLVASSYILSHIAILGPMQLLSVVAIAGAFSLMSFSLGKMITGFKDIAPADALKAAWLMPVVLLGVSVAIAASSYILAQTVPIGLAQAFSVVVIAGAFGAISYGLGNLIGAFKGIKPIEAIAAAALMPLVLIGISYAIVESSKILKNVQWIGLGAAISSVVIAGVFFAISYAIRPLMKSIKDVSVKDMFKGAAMMVIMSASIVASSHLLATMADVGFVQILKFGLLGVATSIVTAMMVVAIKPLKGMAVKDILKGAASIVIISASVSAASYAVAMMAPVTLGGIFMFTALSIGLAVSSFVMALAMFGISKLGTMKDYLQGGLAVVMIAGVISLSSMILSYGEYKKYPSLDWTLGTGVSIFAFAVMTLGLGFLITATGGMGAVALLAGGAAVLGIAALMVGVDAILAMGDYSKFPSSEWIVGTGLSLLIFGVSALAIGALFIGTFGLGAAAMAAGTLAILGIATMIVKTDEILSSGQYTSFPPMLWVQGALGVLSKFTEFISGIGFKDLAKQGIMKLIGGIDGIAKSILKIDLLFSKGSYTKYPSVDWVEGSVGTLSKFSALMSAKSMKDILGDKLKKMAGGGLDKIAHSVLEIDKIFSKGDFAKYPSKAWMEGTLFTLQKYGEMMKLVKNTFKGTAEVAPLKSMVSSITSLAIAFDKLSSSFTKFNDTISSIDAEKLAAVRSMSSSIVLLSLTDPQQFEEIMSSLEDRSGVLSQLVEDFESKKSESTSSGSSGIKMTPVAAGNSDIKDLGMKIDRMTGILADISSVVGSKGTLKTYLNSIKQNQLD